MGAIYKNGVIYYQKDDNDEKLPEELRRKKYLSEALLAALKGNRRYMENLKMKQQNKHEDMLNEKDGMNESESVTKYINFLFQIAVILWIILLVLIFKM